MEKTLIAIVSDPRGGDEALGRAFNAMALAYDLKERNVDVKIVFQGAAVRWPHELSKADHPLNALYQAVKETVEGVCGGCADVFGATASVEETDLPLLRSLQIPGTTGLTPMGKYLKDGYSLVTF